MNKVQGSPVSTGRVGRWWLVLLMVLLSAAACSGSSTPVAVRSPSSSPSASASASPTPEAGGSLSLLSGHLLFGRPNGLVLATSRGETVVSQAGQVCCVVRIAPSHMRVLVMPGTDAIGAVRGGTIDLAGRGFKLLPSTDRSLNLVPQAWSPDGTRIAFEGWDEANPARTGIYTARAVDGSQLVKVTTRPGKQHDVPLDYSPNGRQLVFYRSVGEDPDPQVTGSLWVCNIDGSKAHRVVGPSGRPAAWARWSKDGSRILFANERTAPTGAIWTVKPDGNSITKLFSDTNGGFPIQPTWSPSGQQILFALDPTNDQFDHPANALYIAQADGSRPQLLIKDDVFKSQPEWWG